MFSSTKGRPQTASQQSLIYTKEFKYSGLGYSKRRGAVVVDNNAVNKLIIPASTTKDQAKVWSNN